MKIRLLVAIAAVVFPGLLCASSVMCQSSAGNNPLSSTGCVAANTFSYNDTLNWATAGSAYEGPGYPKLPPWPDSNPSYNTTFTGITAGGRSITATLGSTGTAPVMTPPYLARMDEAPWVYYVGTGGSNDTYWTQPGNQVCQGWNAAGTVCTQGYVSLPYIDTYNGTFNFDTKPADQTPINVNTKDYGTALLGVQDGVSPITLSGSFSDIGFDITSVSTQDFIATLMAYDGTTLLGTYVLNTGLNSGMGGPCTSLASAPSPTGSGTACNSAPFVGIGGAGWHITAVVVSVTDLNYMPVAFAINGAELDYSGHTPEPTTWAMGLAGLGGLVWARKRKARKS